MEDLLFILTLLAALGSGLVAGIFFAFSAFIMSALGRVAAQCGIAAMQSINVTVLKSAVFHGLLRDCRPIARFGDCSAARMVRTRRVLFIGWEPTLFSRLYFRDDGLQRTAQQQTRVRHARKRRRCERIDALLAVLDGLESRMDGRLSCRSRAVYRGPGLADDHWANWR